MAVMDADRSGLNWDQLAQICSRRGFKRLVAVALILAGCVPAIALVIVRTPTAGDSLLVGTLVVAVPTLVLLLWSKRDREGQSARELAMWVRTASRSGVQLPAEAQAAFRDLLIGPQWFETAARDVRESLTPLVAAPGLLALRIAVYRNWYPVLWLVISVLFAVAFFGISLFAPT